MGEKVLAALIIIVTVFWIFNVIISAFAGATENIIFKHRTGDVSNNHTTQVTPDGFTFMIWNVIFLWILLGYIFLIINIFRSSKDGSGKVYCTPAVFTISVALTLIVNCGFYTSWLFVWDNQYMTASCILLFCIMGTNWIALALFSYNLYDKTNNLQEQSPVVLICYRLLLQNSFATYTTWTTVAALVNLAIALVYDAELKDPTPSIISLSLLTAIVAVWCALDVFLLDNYCRYMVSPLFVVIWGLVGIFSRLQKHENDEDDSTPKHFTIGLIGILSVLLISRVGLTVFRHFKKPLQ